MAGSVPLAEPEGAAKEPVRRRAGPSASGKLAANPVKRAQRYLAHVCLNMQVHACVVCRPQAQHGLPAWCPAAAVCGRRPSGWPCSQETAASPAAPRPPTAPCLQRLGRMGRVWCQWEHAKPCADAAAAHASEAAAAPALKGCTQQRTRALSHELDAFQAAHPTPKTHAGVQHSTAQRTDVPQRELSALLVAHHPARQRQAAGLEGWAQEGGAEHGPAINSGGGGSGRVRAGRHGRRQAAGHGTTLRMW